MIKDIVSDGKKYVWAAINRAGNPHIYAFDIDSASLVGSFQTCSSPDSLEYHPLRDEIWVRCTDVEVNSTVATNLDVFSASTPGVDIQVDILTKERALNEGLTSNGYSVVDYTLGDVGYMTDSDLPHLFQVDLSQKTIVNKFEMPAPTPHGLYNAVYSPINKHIFIRSMVCCTCGFEGADLDTCGTRTPYNVTTTTGSYV